MSIHFLAGAAAAGGDKGAEVKKEVEELILDPITIDFLKQVNSSFIVYINLS